MKKITTLLLSLLLCFFLFTACEPVSDILSSSNGSDVITSVDSSIVNPPVEEPSVLEQAITNINALYKADFNANNVKSTSFQVVKQVRIGSDIVPITWTVDVAEGVTVTDLNEEDYFVDVVIGEAPANEINFVLTATVSDAEGNSLSTSYNLVVPAYKVNTYAEYAAAKNGDNLTVRGIVIGIESKELEDSANSLFLQDLNNEGGYYLYGLTELPEGIAVGMTVEAAGVFELYNGTYELKNVSAKIIDTNVTEVAPVDYTEAFVNAADTKAEALVARQAMLVTVKGVTITDQNADQGYLNFSLAGKTSYLRISSSHNCITTAECNAMKALHAASFGSVADVTGYVAIFSGAFYLVPVSTDAISNVRVPERSDAEKVELEKGALKVIESLNANTTITLPTAGTTYENVAIAWESNSEYAVVNGGEVAITVPDEKATVTLTATLTLGEVTETATFEIVLNKVPTALKELIAIGEAQAHNTYTAEKYIAEGIITEVYNTTYGNMYIQDNEGTVFTVYGLYANGKKYGEMETKPVAGDYIRVTAAVGQYNGTAQMKNADLIAHATPSTLAEVTELGIAQGHNTYTTEKYLVVATITEVYNTTYGNFYLTDATTEKFTVYGAYDVRGVRFDKFAVQPKAGDTVGVYGVVGQYNGTAQIKNGVIVYLKAGTAPAPTCPGCGVEGDAHAKCEHCGEYTCVGDHSNCGAVVPPVVSNEITLTYSNLGLGDPYKAGEATVDGVTFAYTELGYFGNGIQMRINKNDSSKKSTLGNSTAFAHGIKEIRLTYNSAKSTYDNAGAFTFTFGTDSSLSSYSVNMDTVKGEKSYVVTPDATTYTYFKMSINLSYSFYWDSIVIVLDGEGGSVEPAPTCPGCGAEGDAHQVCDACGEYLCVSEKNHGLCEYCGNKLCAGDHSNCGAVVPPVENPFDGEYYLAMDQGNLGKTLYFKGSMSGYYFATTENTAEAAVLTIEVTEGGYYLAFTVNGGSKNYIKIFANGTYTNVGFGATAECVFSYNETYKTFTTKVNGTEYYMGTYNTFNTFSASKISYAGNAGNFVSYLVKIGGSVEPAPTCPGCGVEGDAHQVCDACGEYLCVSEKNHDVCEYCEQKLCAGDHSNCGAVVPPVENNNFADFNTIVTSNANGDSSYTKTFTTTNGWVTANSAIQTGGPEGCSNPQYHVIGPDNTTKAVCMNGKTSAPGSITSPTLNNGISVLRITYTKMFTDTMLSATITLTDLATSAVYTNVVEREVHKTDDKYVVWNFEWVLDTQITGDFTIEIVNDCPSASTSNKDRMTILSITWDSAAAAPAPTCPGCGAEGDAHEVCEACLEYLCVSTKEHGLCEFCQDNLCVGDHSACAPATISIAAALAATDGTEIVVTGIVVTVNGAWNTQYNNMNVTISDGTNTLYVYRLSTQVKLWDVITVTGKMATYEGARQVAAGATATIDGTHTEHTVGEWTKDEDNHWHVCTECGEKVDNAAHTGGTATETEQAKCDVCGQAYGDLAGAAPSEFVFDLGSNGSASHNDGTEIAASGKSWTVGDYTLKVTGTKAYHTARDAKGNSCIKLGTSKLIGSITFTVPDDINKVVIYVSGYKAKTVSVIVNGGTAQNISTTSDTGNYTAIEIDTSSNKTVTFETKANYRAMVNTIEFHK